MLVLLKNENRIVLMENDQVTDNIHIYFGYANTTIFEEYYRNKPDIVTYAHYEHYDFYNFHQRVELLDTFKHILDFCFLNSVGVRRPYNSKVYDYNDFNFTAKLTLLTWLEHNRLNDTLLLLKRNTTRTQFRLVFIYDKDTVAYTYEFDFYFVLCYMTDDFYFQFDNMNMLFFRDNNDNSTLIGVDGYSSLLKNVVTNNKDERPRNVVIRTITIINKIRKELGISDNTNLEFDLILDKVICNQLTTMNDFKIEMSVVVWNRILAKRQLMDFNCRLFNELRQLVAKQVLLNKYTKIAIHINEDLDLVGYDYDF